MVFENSIGERCDATRQNLEWTIAMMTWWYNAEIEGFEASILA